MKIINTTDKNKCNCVLWLRDRLPELPHGLWTLDDKKKIINSDKPVVGSGAMSRDGVWFEHNGKRVFSGHVALVTKVKDSILTIREANYKSCTITERTGTMNELHLVGFFVPDSLNIKEEQMNKDLQKAIESITGQEYGDNMNDNEQDRAAEELNERTEKWEQLELTYHDLVNTHKKKNEHISDMEREINELANVKEKYKTDLEDVKSQKQDLIEAGKRMAESIVGLENELAKKQREINELGKQKIVSIGDAILFIIKKFKK